MSHIHFDVITGVARQSKCTSVHEHVLSLHPLINASHSALRQKSTFFAFVPRLGVHDEAAKQEIGFSHLSSTPSRTLRATQHRHTRRGPHERSSRTWSTPRTAGRLFGRTRNDLSQGFELAVSIRIPPIDDVANEVHGVFEGTATVRGGCLRRTEGSLAGMAAAPSHGCASRGGRGEGRVGGREGLEGSRRRRGEKG